MSKKKLSLGMNRIECFEIPNTTLQKILLNKTKIYKLKRINQKGITIKKANTVKPRFSIKSLKFIKKNT